MCATAPRILLPERKGTDSMERRISHWWHVVSIPCLMAYSHCMGLELALRQVQGTGSGLMDPKILYRNVLTGARQRPIVSYCASPIPRTYQVSVL